MGAAVVHFEISSRDAKRAQEFYGTLFDWTFDANNPLNYIMVNTGLKTGIGGGIFQATGGAPPYAAFYVQVEDVKACLDKAVSLGARIIIPETVIPNMITFAMFADLDGNVVGLTKGPQNGPAPPRVRARKAMTKKSPVRKKKGTAKGSSKRRSRR
jgi:uncharacterized protein